MHWRRSLVTLFVEVCYTGAARVASVRHPTTVTRPQLTKDYSSPRFIPGWVSSSLVCRPLCTAFSRFSVCRSSKTIVHPSLLQSILVGFRPLVARTSTKKDIGMASTEAGMVGSGFEMSVSASPKPSLLSLGQVRSRVYQVSPMTRGSIVAPAHRMPISSTPSSQADAFDFRGILTFFGAGIWQLYIIAVWFQV